MNKHLRAVNIARCGIFYGYSNNIFLKKLIKQWDDDKDIITRCAKMQVTMNNRYMIMLSIIVKMLTENCKHPKKYRDKTSDDMWYCMNCNSDLSSKLPSI